MTVPGPITLIAIISVGALLVLLLIVNSIRRARANKRAALYSLGETALSEKLDTQMNILARRLEAHQELMMNRLQEDIRGLQSDMDWLAGERMIEEAVNMARCGQNPSAISSELGLSMDAAETITLFRKH